MSTTDTEVLLRRIRTVLLDFDGPVCSIFAGYPAPVVTDELAAVSAAAGHPVPADYLRRQDPLDVLRYAGTVGPDLVALVERELSRAELAAVATAKATSGAEAFLRACRATGRTVAVLSNNSSSAIAHFLDRAGWTHLVRLIEGREPTDPALMKPHPHILLRTLRDLVVSAETAVMIGDSVTDVEAGVAAEVWTIGYANKIGKAEALQESGADAVVVSMTALAEMVRRTRPTSEAR